MKFTGKLIVDGIEHDISVSPVVQTPAPTPATAPWLTDWKAALTLRGLSFKEPVVTGASASPYVYDPRVHDVTEGDYLSTFDELGYKTLADAWHRYYLKDYRASVGPSGDTFKMDVGMGLDHLAGWGLIKRGDPASLAEAVEIAKVVSNLYKPADPHPFGCLASSMCMNYGVRLAGRHLRFFTALAKADPAWVPTRDLVLNRIMAGDGVYDALRGMYWLSADETDKALSWMPNAYASGARVQSPFMLAILIRGLWEAYQTTKRKDVGERIVAVSRFILKNGMNSNLFTGSYFGLIGGQPWHNLGVDNKNADPAYLLVFVAPLVDGYKLTGEQAFLDRAWLHYVRGTNFVAVQDGAPTRVAPDTAIHHAPDEQLDGVYPRIGNGGEWDHVSILFENGGKPIVEAITTPTPTTTEWPAWRKAMLPGEWKKLSFGMNQASRIQARGYVAWTGGTVDPVTSKVYVPHPGGHNDGQANDSLGADLNRETPIAFLAAAGSPQDKWTFDTARYMDGKPSARHTYYGPQFDPINKRVICIGGGYPSVAGGSGGNDVTSFDPATGVYDPAGFYPKCDLPIAAWDQGICANAVCAVVWAGDKYQRLDFATKKWSSIASAPVQDKQPICFDGQGRVFYAGDNGPGFLDISTNKWTPVKLRKADGSLLGNVQGNALVWSDVQNCFLVKSKWSGAIWRVRLPENGVCAVDWWGPKNYGLLPLPPEAPNSYSKSLLKILGLKGFLSIETFTEAWFLSEI